MTRRRNSREKDAPIGRGGRPTSRASSAAAAAGFAVLLVAGCASAPALPPPVYDADALAAPAAPVASGERVDPFLLPPERVAWMRSRIDPLQVEPERLRALVDLFGTGEVLDVRYDLTTSLDAEGTLAAGRGNCLGFTVAFVALARALDLQAGVREVRIPDAWGRRGSVAVSSRHVVAWGRTGSGYWEVDFGALQGSETAPGRHLDDAEVAARLASNQGADALIRGELDLAGERLAAAVSLAPDLAHGWTNLAVLHARRGDPARAESAFREALDHAPGDGAALAGLLRLYRTSGHESAAARLEAALPALLARNPYVLYGQALEAERRGEFVLAEDLYEEAVRREGAEPWFHLGVIRARLARSDRIGARRAATRARRALDGERALVEALDRLADARDATETGAAFVQLAKRSGVDPRKPRSTTPENKKR